MSSGDDEDFAKLLAESESASPAQRRIAEGDVVRGRVVGIGHETAFVAIGAKAEAILDLAEFRDPESGEVRLAIGDQVEATVTDDGRRSGSIVLKRTLGRGGHVPGELEQAMEHGLAVEGVVTGQNKGGFDVQIAGVRAFCPASQMDLRRGEPETYIGERLRFRVSRIEGGGRNVVVSRRSLLEEEAASSAAGLWERLSVGDIVTGKVSSLRDFGAFVDIGGIEGLLHVSELGHTRVNHPSEVLSVGQTVEAKVSRLEKPEPGGRGRISLSIKALAPDPWSDVVDRFPVGTSVRGTVRRVEQFGAFVEVMPGIDGLVHVSKLALDRRVSHPRQVVSVGDEVDVTVVGLDPEKKRLSLSMVESARRSRDAAEDAERKETAEVVDRTNMAQRLGTLGDIFAAQRKPK